MSEDTKSNIKRDRFIKIAEKRVNNILLNLDSLGNCSNRRNYEYSEADVKRIFIEIDKKIRETKLKFDDTITGKQRFKLNP